MENLSNEIEVIESVCFTCHSNCGTLVHVQDGRVSKVKSGHD
jgi:anaerobic selenocysteine-containing dehydrogenase